MHGLRGVSLHPIEPSSVLGNCDAQKYDQYVKDSARLQTTMEILTQIQNNQVEKALLFIETINMQHLMAAIIKRHYGLNKLPFIINGNTGGDKIQDYVDSFQKDSGFDVMILSPKVGGVGLTLTAANHVIHLSRWWNPAVEDQSTDRVYRLGQKRDVHVYYPVAVHPDIGTDSFDFKLHDLLERKRQLSRDMLLPIDDESDIETIYRGVVGRLEN